MTLENKKVYFVLFNSIVSSSNTDSISKLVVIVILSKHRHRVFMLHITHQILVYKMEVKDSLTMA